VSLSKLTPETFWGGRDFKGPKEIETGYEKVGEVVDMKPSISLSLQMSRGGGRLINYLHLCTLLSPFALYSMITSTLYIHCCNTASPILNELVQQGLILWLMFLAVIQSGGLWISKPDPALR